MIFLLNIVLNKTLIYTIITIIHIFIHFSALSSF